MESQIATIVDPLLDLIDLGVLAVDREGRITLWNRWLEERSGRQRTDVLGQVLWELYPDIRERGLDARIRDVLERNQPLILSPTLHGHLLPLRGPAGRLMVQLVRIVPMEENGEVAGAFITLQDVTAAIHVEAELLRATEQLRLLQETAGSLAAMQSLEETLQTIAQRALEVLDARAVVILIRDEPAAVLRAVARAFRMDPQRLDEAMHQVMGGRPAQLSVPLSQTESALVRVATTGRPVIGARIAELGSSRLSKLVLRALRGVLGAEAVTILPLQVADRVVGVMTFDSPPREEITPHDEALYRTFAHQAAVAIENARLFLETRQQAERLQRLERAVESLDQMVLITDHQGQVHYVNPALTCTLGYRSDELVGQPAKSVLPPDQATEMSRQLHQGLEETGSWRGEWKMVRRDGRVIRVAITASLVGDEAGQVLGMIAVGTDVTLARRREELLEALKRIALTAGQVLDRGALFDAVIAEMRRLEITAHILTYDSAREELIVVRTSLSESKLRELSDMIGLPAIGYRMPARALTPWLDLAQGEPIFVEDCTDIVRAVLPEKVRHLASAFAELIGSRRGIGVPLVARGQVLGVFAVCSDLIGPGDLSLFRIFGGFLSAALENARLFAQLRRQRSALAEEVRHRTAELQILFELSQQLGRALSYDALARLVLEAVDQTLASDVCGILLAIGDQPELLMHHHRPISSSLESALRDQMLETLRTVDGTAMTVGQVRVRSLPAPDYDPQAPPLQEVSHSVFAPLMMQDRLVGLLQVCTAREEAFSADQVRLLHALAYQTVLALQRLQAILERERALLQAMVESMADGVILLDEGGRLVAANAQGRGLYARLCKCDGEKTCPLHDLMRTALTDHEKAVDQEMSVRDQFYVARAAPAVISHPEGAFRGVVITLRDVTEQHLIQEQLFQASKLAAIGELAAGVAHEINNPLTAIIGFSELLLADAQDEGTRDALERIREQGLHARNIVQNLLNFARSQHLAQGVVDLNVTIKQAVDLVRRQLELDGIQVLEEYAPDLPRIVGDAGQLQQVVLNLLQNAHDAIMLGGQGGQVVVRTRRLDEERIAFEVEDDGPGIPEEIRERIFNPFFTTKPPGKGTGLGLSISFKIVQKHDGQIMVHSRPGEGARFTVVLPVREVEERPLLARPSEEWLSGPALRVLVVDDEPAALEVITRMLQEAGHHVDSVTRGQEALARLADQAYDVILLDLKMPDLSGQEVYRRLQAEHPELAERVLFVSGVAFDEEIQAFLRAVGRPVLSKPFGQEELLAAVRQVGQPARG